MPCLLCYNHTKPYFNYGRYTNQPYRLVRCGACGLVQTEPMPTGEFLREWYQRYDVLGEREPYYQVLTGAHPLDTSEGMDIARRFGWVKRAMANCAAQIANRPDDTRLAIGDKPKVLDVGSGPGVFLDLVRRAGWEGIGVELNYRAAAASRERYGIDVREGALESVGLPRESFDVVTLWDIVEHVRDPRRLLERAHALLAPGGALFIETPNSAALLDRAAIMLARFGIPRPAATFYGVHHLTLWNQKNIRRLLESIGFRVEAITLDTTPAGRVFRGVSLHDRLMRFGVSTIQNIGKLLRRENKMIITSRKTTAPH
ncbi:class I SAM-dependent methyltransferase [Candidatus Uhrbacteria bacterium]|nr:class I SAM-dependent methyltransferase [Candidatus Uhrbacteria bacterium]